MSCGGRPWHEYLHAYRVASLEGREVVHLTAREYRGLRLQHILTHLMLRIYHCVHQMLPIVLECEAFAARHAINLMLLC